MSPYAQQWVRIQHAVDQRKLPVVAYMALAKRHHDWFLRQPNFNDASQPMVDELRKIADQFEVR